MGIKVRATLIAVAVAAAAAASLGMGPAHGQEAPASCVWGGTPAAPTGTFTIEPGIRTTPAPYPLKLKATGPAEGTACKDTVTFEGWVRAGSTCALLHFEGTVRGVAGVETFWGPGNVVAHEFLYDRQGNLVGFNNPTIVNRELIEGLVESPDSCNTPEGVTHGSFSSTIELFANPN
jgi:hypothetical protein